MKTVCHCCEPPAGIDPQLSNRPSLSAIAYRIGTFSRFRASMLDEIADHPELALLTSRDSDDYGITLLELWAAIADVLTFYQERYANEAFLRTAEFRDSVARVAALIGYRPRPGVAARAWLAFTLNEPGPVPIPIGQSVQSVPGQDEEPQKYETLEEIQAFEALNDPRVFPAPKLVNPLAQGLTEGVLEFLRGPELAEPLGPDQKVVIFNLSTALAVEAVQQAAAALQVQSQASPGVQQFMQSGALGQAEVQSEVLGGFGGAEAVQTGGSIVNSIDLGTIEQEIGAALGDVFVGPLSPGVFQSAAEPVEEKKIAAVETRDHRMVIRWDQPIQKNAWKASSRAFRYRRTLRVFGHNAPRSYVQPRADPANPGDATKIIWAFETRTDASLPASTHLFLDGKYEDLQVGQRLLVSDTGTGGVNSLVRIVDVDQVPHTYEPLSDTVTRLRVDSQVPRAGDRGNVVIYELVGDELSFSTIGYDPTIPGDAVYVPGVARLVEDEVGIEISRPIERGEFGRGHVLLASSIEEGRALILHDEGGDPVVVAVREPPTIQPASAQDGELCHLKIPVESQEAWALDTETAILRGNVAHASHGETVPDELLGAGDASKTFQRFELKKGPLTYLPSTGADGVASTLDFTVGGVRWREIPQLFGRAATAPVAELRHDADGNALIQAGDGTFGARLPTGADVRATYRVGSGLDGRVAAESLTTLLQKPPGVTEVVNPLAAEGGADPETLETSRLNAPRGVRTFGRIVSVRDFEDQITLSGEVAKALATPVWDGLDQAIHLTVAAQGGAAFTSDALAELGRNLESVRDPNHRLRIDNYALVHIELRGGIGIDAGADADEVLAQAKQAVLDALSFDAMSLGESVNLSDMYRVIQDVPGVRFVDVDRFMFKLSSFGGFWNALIELWRRGVLGAGFAVNPVQSRLRIFPARTDPANPGSVLPAELAAIEAPDEDVVLGLREGS